ncbi:hypothetical protein HDV05_008571 [Chytridiales sp. JEL 0842]|nr:hypothetical protein HDV05_008571 [Chytridiales sp. JEL 0842]
MPTFYSLPFQRHFRAPLISQPSLLFLILSCASIILPFIIAYISQSLWVKENTFREQPGVFYTKQALINLDGVSKATGEPINVFFSTMGDVNLLYEQSVRGVPTIATTERDEDRDRLVDTMEFEIKVPLLESDSIHRVRVAFFVLYELNGFIRLTMQSMAHFESSTPIPASAVYVDGDLKFNQRKLLDWGIDSLEYNFPVLNASLAVQGADSRALGWERVLGGYMDRDFRTDLVTSTPVWTHSRAPGEPFIISGKIRFSSDKFLYRPGVLEVLKMSWIQYFSIFAIVGWILRCVYVWMVKAQMVKTHVVVDVLPKQGGFKAHMF